MGSFLTPTLIIDVLFLLDSQKLHKTKETL